MSWKWLIFVVIVIIVVVGDETRREYCIRANTLGGGSDDFHLFIHCFLINVVVVRVFNVIAFILAFLLKSFQVKLTSLLALVSVERPHQKTDI